MNTIRIKTGIVAIFALLWVSVSFSQESDTSTNGNKYADSIASMEMFQQQLSDQGEWIKIDSNEIDADAIKAEVTENNEGVDDYINKEVIWRPNISDPDWNPYRYGCWRYTNWGWVWVSYYKWGWYTCHYGRWWWSEDYGWVWSPGYIWAPAWVNWCYNDNSVGWYPMSPRHRWHHGHHGHHYDLGGHDNTVISHTQWHHQNWTFVSSSDFEKTIDHTTIIDPKKTPELIGSGTITNDITITRGGKVTSGGPKKTDIEKTTGEKIPTVNIDKMGEKNKHLLVDDEIQKQQTEGTDVKEKQKEIFRTSDDGSKKSSDNGEKNYTGEKPKADDNVKKEDQGKNPTFYPPTKEYPKEYPKEEPRKEEPKKEQPRKEEPRKEQPKREEPRKEEPRKEQPKREEPRKEEPKIEQPRDYPKQKQNDPPPPSNNDDGKDNQKKGK